MVYQLFVKIALITIFLSSASHIVWAHEKIVVIPMPADDSTICHPLVVPAFSTVLPPTEFFESSFYIDVTKTCPEFVAGYFEIPDPHGGSVPFRVSTTVISSGAPDGELESIYLEIVSSSAPGSSPTIIYHFDGDDEPVIFGGSAIVEVMTNNRSSIKCFGEVGFEHYNGNGVRILISREIVLECNN